MTIAAAALTDAGLERRINEDAVAMAAASNGGGARRDFLAVVADGMGGHGHGDVASRLAVTAVIAGYAHGADNPASALRDAVEAANRAVFTAARERVDLRGMGTTCTAIAIRGREAVCAHVGDSRLYLLRAGTLYTMTEDHSAVRDLVARGLLTPGAARHHADRNVLSRAVGTAHDVHVAVWPEPLALRSGDRLLLSTDGLHGLVGDEEMRDAMAAQTPDGACRELIALARARGGPDNITAAVLHFEGDLS